MSNATASSGAVKTVSMATSSYGTAEPQIEVRLPKDSGHRALSAALHQLAAAIELATPARERWCVQVQQFGDTRGRVYLELARGSAEEAERGLLVLRSVIPGEAAVAETASPRPKPAPSL